MLVVFSRMPGGLFGQMQAASDAPPPAWLHRFARPDPAAERVVKSRPFTLYFGLLGGIGACLVLGSITGTVGWGSTLLLGYAITGRWPERARSPD